MIEKFKMYIKQLRCKHDMKTIRWHWVHFPNSEPLSVEVEYRCDKCDKIEHIHLYGVNAKQWSNVMGEYLKDC